MQRTVVITIASSLLFAGCSSGGSGGGETVVGTPDLTVSITPNNAMEVAKVSWATALESVEFSDLTGTGLFIGGTSGGVSKLDDAISRSAKLQGGQSQTGG